MPLFSVVVPIHNKGRHVRRALESALGQTFTDFEVLAVDDASTDDSVEQVERLSDPRLRLLRRSMPNSGGYAARNLAVEQADAPWVAFLDADDSWDSGFLAAIARGLEGASAADGAISTRFRVVGGWPMPAQRGIPVEVGDGSVDFTGFLNLWLHRRACPVWTSALAVRRDVLKAAGGFPEQRCRRGGDKDTWLRVMRRTRLRHVPEVLATYYRDADNMVTRTQQVTARHCIDETVEELLRSENDPHIRRLLQEVLNCEIWSYFVQVLRSGGHQALDLTNFSAAADPLRYLAMRAIAAVPGPAVCAVSLLTRARLKGNRPGR
jgi:glycosyltransferase involved in cell wall biosynthesis